jgi:hypothetical protein
MKVISDPGGFAANGEEARPAKSLFWACINENEGLVTNGFQHHRVKHRENEFAKSKNHFNGIESFLSYAKFRVANFAESGRKSFLFTSKNWSSVSIIEVITFTQFR